ncbi:ras GEF [Pluteus cervinus]|uniref:Ras GEF n=1 Tax=Pluteus cervinus TaxID=181527 RepID=A0ACD3BA71_9AGAR|nr:ras GEF [Pluteus cervinus]
MYPSHLKIDTSVGGFAGPSSSKLSARQHQTPSPLPGKSPAGSGVIGRRARSASNASTSSSISIVSPNSASTNGSTSSLLLPSETLGNRSRSTSPISPTFDDTVKLGPEYVLAMHDYAPQQQGANCLSFRAGQVIHVLNRDSSGWWDGELEGRRGWFPSNYVNTDVIAIADEELPETPFKPGHTSSQSSASVTSWVSGSSHGLSHHRKVSSTSDSGSQELDPHCHPLMYPLLRGLSFLHTTVRDNRVFHYLPCIATIVKCVREILLDTQTLPRDAPILQQFPPIAQERRRVLSVLSLLVAQAKRVCKETLGDEAQEAGADDMLRLGGQVFAHVRRFLAVAVQCGVELPDPRLDSDGIPGSTGTERHSWAYSDQSFEAPQVAYGVDAPDSETPRQVRTRQDILATVGSNLRTKSSGDLQGRVQKPEEDDADSLLPLLPGRSLSNQSKAEKYMPQEHRRHKPGVTSISSISSSSSVSSQDSVGPSTPVFPVGPTSSSQAIEALRFIHDQFLSTIAAFIGHAHSHTRTSHASSTGHLYDLVREIVEMVCKILTIVEAVIHHPDIPSQKITSLKAVKEGLYGVTSILAESVRILTLSAPPTMSEEEEKQALLRAATGTLKAGGDCVTTVRSSLLRKVGESPIIIDLPVADSGPGQFTPGKFTKPKGSALMAIHGYPFNGVDDEDLTIQAQTPSPVRRPREISVASVTSNDSQVSSLDSMTTAVRTPDESKPMLPLSISIIDTPVEPDLPSPTSFAPTDEDGTTWEGSALGHSLEEKILNGDLPAVPLDPIPEHAQETGEWIVSHDYALEDVAYNTDGHLVGATIQALVEKMTPHDSIVDAAFSAVFFMTFRLFSSPVELVDALIVRYNVEPERQLSADEYNLWRQTKGLPVRLRVSNFIKMWVETYWRSAVDAPALPILANFTKEGLAPYYPGPAQRILELLELRRQSSDQAISPRGDRIRDPGMSINPPMTSVQPSEIPRPSMTKTLLSALRSKNFGSISVTDFDALELARQMTIMECTLYCAIQPEEILESGQEGAKLPVNVRAVSSLSTVITGWVAESILSEPDLKKRTGLMKFFIKVADRCMTLQNYSTSRSMLAALDSSTIARLHQTWAGVPQKYKTLLDALRRLADHSRNYHEYRTRLRNTAPPAVPFLGVYHFNYRSFDLLLSADQYLRPVSH